MLNFANNKKFMKFSQKIFLKKNKKQLKLSINLSIKCIIHILNI